jgi:hypothetical protein
MPTKKNRLKPWQVQAWVIPSVSAEFVFHMEDVLDRYAETEDLTRPHVCVDERPVQLISEVHEVVPATPDHLERHDDEYKREGTANLYMIACRSGVNDM